MARTRKPRKKAPKQATTPTTIMVKLNNSKLTGPHLVGYPVAHLKDGGTQQFFMNREYSVDPENPCIKRLLANRVLIQVQ